MNLVLKLAQKGKNTCTPNPMVACIIVKDKQIIAKGYHKRSGDKHAEIIALHNAKTSVANATMYVNLEPCSHIGKTPACVDEIINAKIKRVVIALKDPDPRVNGNGIIALEKAKINCEIGVLEEESRYLNRGFIKRNKKSFPWIHLKTATTLDGKIAQNNGHSKWITGSEARIEVQKIRASSCAILTTSNTAIADNPQLTVRDIKTSRHPKVFLIDRKLRCPKSLKLLKKELVIFTSVSNANKSYPANITLEPIKNINSTKGIIEIFKILAKKYLINYLLIECGGKFAGTLIKNCLVDEITGFIAPKYLGEGMSVANMSGFKLNNLPNYQLQECNKVGNDIMFNLIKGK